MKYSRAFYRSQRDGSLRSAIAILPIVFDLVKPKSVVDVGCGVGTWLRVCDQLGVQRYLGIDGEYVDSSQLVISPSNFMSHDLAKAFEIDSSFDLVLCLEVAEHIPSSATETFIDSLTSLGPVILFSAAIPFQGGTFHLNEQWPEYWEEKFSRRGYRLIDCIRSKIWHDENVDPWYAQNCYIYINNYRLGDNEELDKVAVQGSPKMLSAVHPKLWSYYRTPVFVRRLENLLRLVKFPGKPGKL